jgi:hypothetical protein
MKKGLKLRSNNKKKMKKKKKKNMMIRRRKSRKAVLPNTKEINLFGALKI